jgi:simple sugar transport system ATP-binding protein
VVELRNVHTRAAGGDSALKGVNLIIRAGEIVGVAGLPGNGQHELGDVILGVQRCRTGQKLLFGEDATRWPVRKVRERGIAFLPENPLYMSAVPAMTLVENMALAATTTYARQRGLSLDWAQVKSDLGDALKTLGLRLPPLTARAETLSGGNLQRFTLARELSRQPRLVVTLQPTRGLDVPTAYHARNLLMAARDRGAGVLLISQDLAELFALSDRLLVLREGVIVGSLLPEQTSPYEVGWLMTGEAGQEISEEGVV